MHLKATVRPLTMSKTHIKSKNNQQNAPKWFRKKIQKRKPTVWLMQNNKRKTNTDYTATNDNHCITDSWLRDNLNLICVWGQATIITYSSFFSLQMIRLQQWHGGWWPSLSGLHHYYGLYSRYLDGVRKFMYTIVTICM